MEKAILLNHKTIHLRLPLEMSHNILYHCRKVPYTGEKKVRVIYRRLGKKNPSTPNRRGTYDVPVISPKCSITKLPKTRGS